MIRVLHTIDTTGSGGAETIFVNLVKGLDTKKFKSVAAICGPGWLCDTLRKNGIEPVFVQSQGGFNRRYLLELVRIVKEYKIQLIQSHLLGSNLYSSMAGLICRVPVISTLHGFVDVNNKERLMGFKSWIINLGSQRIVFVSDRLREHYVKNLNFSSKKSVTIYNGVDTSVFYPCKDDSLRKELGIGSENVLIGAVGNFRPAKGYDLFLRAARLVYEDHPETRFIVAGQGAGNLYEDLLKLRSSLGLEQVVYFTGFQDNAPKIYNNLDIFVLPSISEGFSISTIEAMACGLPVVATKSGGPEEIIDNNINGKLVECSAMDLADAIICLLVNTDIQKFLSQNSFQKINSKYSLSNVFKMYEDLYEQFVSSH